jgi:hypothetical protein
MPYYDDGNLFLAGEPSDLIARLEEVASSAPPAAAQVLDQVYGTGADRLVPFADMLIVHELAHAFHDGVSFVFPRSWLMELFANMALYAYVVAEEPDRRLHFETLPQVALEYRLLKPVARDLRYFEAFYPYIEPLTYVWYQFRFTIMAKGVVDAAGPDVLRRLWDAFALSDEQLAGVLGSRVHPAAGQWLASWNEQLWMTFHGDSRSGRAATAFITRSPARSWPPWGARCTCHLERACSTWPAGPGRCCVPGRAITG